MYLLTDLHFLEKRKRIKSSLQVLSTSNGASIPFEQTQMKTGNGLTSNVRTIDEYSRFVDFT